MKQLWYSTGAKESMARYGEAKAGGAEYVSERESAGAARGEV